MQYKAVTARVLHAFVVLSVLSLFLWRYCYLPQDDDRPRVVSLATNAPAAQPRSNEATQVPSNTATQLLLPSEATVVAITNTVAESNSNAPAALPVTQMVEDIDASVASITNTVTEISTNAQPETATQTVENTEAAVPTITNATDAISTNEPTEERSVDE